MSQVVLLPSHLAHIRRHAKEDNDVVFPGILGGVEAAHGKKTAASMEILCESKKPRRKGWEWEVLSSSLTAVQSQAWCIRLLGGHLLAARGVFLLLLKWAMAASISTISSLFRT